MGLRIFSQLAFGAFVLLIGQLSIGGQTIGHRFLAQITKGSLWVVDQVKESKLFSDVMDVKAKAEKIEKIPKVIEANVAAELEKTKEKIGDIGQRLEQARLEALEGLKKAKKKAGIEEFSNDEFIDEEDTGQIGSLDQEAVKKNLR